MINKIIKQNYNSVIKLLLLSIISNFILIFLMLTQNIMFYKANFSPVNVTQVVNVNQQNEKRININNCSKKALESLPGIGENKSNSIIKHRPYKDIYELKNVIGETAFSKLKDMVET